MSFRLRCTLSVLVCHLLAIQGIYIPPVMTSRHCQESDENLKDAMTRLASFYTLSSLNTTMYVQQSNSIRVDESEYRNIRKFCSNSRSTFQNILDFKFYSDTVRFSEGHLSTCPWVFVDNYDNDRLPRVISEAQCMCRRCLQKTKNSNGDVQYVPKLGRCKQIMTSVMTVRRECNYDSGLYEYVAKAERIAVGCTCTSPVHV